MEKLQKQLSTIEIDEHLYSRQLYVLGHDAMRKMQSSNILICGMGGLGVEIAKNIILAGVKSVTIHDQKSVCFSDLSSQYFLKEADIGKNRAECSHSCLAELNTYVLVSLHTASLDLDFLKGFQVVILTDSGTPEQLSIGQFCHDANIKFLVADTKGVFGKIFCDFGKGFQVVDKNGLSEKSSMISYISRDINGIVTTFDEKRHDLEDGDHVRFSEVRGMTQVNGKEFQVKVLSPFSFSIGDTSQFSDYENSGIVTESKKSIQLDFKPIHESVYSPDYLVSDYVKESDNDTIHLAYQGLCTYHAANGRFPRPWSKPDALAFVENCKQLNTSLSNPFQNLNESLLMLFAGVCSGSLCPVQSIIGGLVAQEAIKACSGKFHPIKQYFYYDCRECLPSDYMNMFHDKENIEHDLHRYHSQENIFGKDFQKKLADLKIFLVGSGALGCEYLKNFAMMGLCCGVDGGHVTVTDMDTIERSNLNRQFLFRSWDVQQPKAQVSMRAAKSMNSQINVKANLNRVAPDTEHIYNHEFFESLDIVCNALDNVKARLYIDSRCIQHKKPLIESGTLGTEANTQIILPHLTEAYSSSQDPPEKSFPICTLKNFPNSIEHTLQWARDAFQGLFYNPAVSAQAFIKDPDNFMATLAKQTAQQQLDELGMLEKILVKENFTSFSECILWARSVWQENYHNTIKQILFNFPPDQTTSSGVPFWSGPKRCPHALNFDASNSLHFDFVKSAANLKAFMHGIKHDTDRKSFTEALNGIGVEEYHAKDGVKISLSEDEPNTEDLNDEDAMKIEHLKEVLLQQAGQFRDKIRLNPVEFEKDDDSNFHMEFITACSNLRAENYDITPSDKHNSKLIAGKIIPAIATTTSVIVGLDCVELIKIVQGHNDLAKFKNTYINLALPFFSSSEPMEVSKNKYNQVEWSLWDSFEIRRNLTLKEFLEHFSVKHNLKVSMVNQQFVTLYSDYLPRAKIEERMDMKMTDILESIQKQKIPEQTRMLVLGISCSDTNGEDVDVPLVNYYFK